MSFLFRGKSIVFVHTVDRCYKLKLFLEQFGIPTCVLNSELPAISRCRAVSQFNSGTYDIIISSDEKVLEEVKHIYIKTYIQGGEKVPGHLNNF